MDESTWTTLQSIFEQIISQPLVDQRKSLDTMLRNGEIDQTLHARLVRMVEAHSGPPLALEDGVGSGESLPEFIGAYRVVRRIARGGMGDVLLAERADGTFERKVAIKLLLGHRSGKQWQARFAQERHIHARLQHPNIAGVLDAGISDQEIPYLVIEYVEGQHILQFARDHRLIIDKRLRLIEQVCNAVAFAHNHLILHRDIKPSNILVDQSGVVKLLDFGIAKLLSEDDSGADQTRTGQRLLTPRYASPEQISGESLSVTSDVFSLGVVLYELIAGESPFQSVSDHGLADKVLRADIAPPYRCAWSGEKVSPDLQAICLKALQRKPSDRYLSANALADDINRLLRHETISARRPNWWDKLVRQWRAHPVGMSASIATIVLITFTAGIAALQARQARMERDHAQQVSEMLIDLFDSDPYGEDEARRSDITLQDFLLRRGQALRDDIPDDPELQARLFQLFADLLVNLNQLEKAETYAEDAVNLRRAMRAGPRGHLATALNTLGRVRLFQGKFSEAESLYRESLAIRETLYPEASVEVAVALNDLSVMLNYADSQANLQEVLELDQRVLEIYLQLFGEDSIQASQSYNNIAATLLYREEPGDLEQAATLFERALRVRQRVLGEEHANTLNTMSNLANVLHDLGDHDRAARLFEGALEGTRAAVGATHTRVGDVLYGYAKLQVDMGNLERAEQSLVESVSIYRAGFPEDHPFVADTLLELGKVQLLRSAWRRAIDTLEDAENLLSAQEDQRTLWMEARYHLVRALLLNGDRQKAERETDEMLADLESTGESTEMIQKVRSLRDDVTVQ